MSKLYIEQMQTALQNVKQIVDQTDKEIADLFTSEELRNSGKVYLAGDGTAYAAAYALKTAFVQFTDWTGNWVFPMTERDFAYEVLKGDLGFGKNFVLLMHCQDTDTQIAADAADKCKKYGCLSYVATTDQEPVQGYMELIAKGICMALAIGTAQQKITPDRAAEVKQKLIDYCNQLLQDIPQINNQCGEIAHRMGQQVRNFETIGTGMDYAAAWLIRLLLYRSTGRVTTVEESEDYLHVNSLNVEPDKFATIIVNSAGNPAYDRTLLTIGNVELTNRFGVVMSDGAKQDLPCPMDFVQLPSSDEYSLKAMGNFVPGALIAEQIQL